MLRRVIGVLASVAVVAVSAVTPAAAAVAVSRSGVPRSGVSVSPGSGPVEGGTEVTLSGVDLTRITQVSAGRMHAVGLGSDGVVYAWGSNEHGQLGDGSTLSRSVPVQVVAGAVPAGVTFTQVAAGTDHTVALGSDGAAYAWGTNGHGQLGDGSTADRAVPVRVAAGAVPAGVTFTQVAAGADHTVALGSDGAAYAWGGNTTGQLGIGTGIGSPESSPVPVRVVAGAVPADVTFTQVAAGAEHTVVLGSDGAAYAWGSSSSGQVGDGSAPSDQQPVPVRVAAGAVPAGVTFTRVSAGARHSAGSGSDGALYAWGSNASGQLGDGSTADSPAPVQVIAGDVPAGVTFDQVGAGADHTVASGSDGAAYAWGGNGMGQLGIGWGGTGGPVVVPTRVRAGAVPAGVTLTQVAGGGEHSTGLGSDGLVYSWGSNDQGQLGDGSSGPFPEPVVVRDDVDVLFGEEPGVDVRVVDRSSGELVVTTPAHPAGVVDVVVLPSWAGGQVPAPVGQFEFVAAPGEVDLTESGSTIEVDVTQVPADGTSVATATVTLLDAEGNPTGDAGQDVVIGSDLGAVSTTTSHGDGTFTATVSATVPGAATLAFTVDDVAGANTAVVVFTSVGVQVSVARDELRVGDRQSVTGSGFVPGEVVQVVMASDPVVVGEVVVDAGGGAELEFVVPSVAPGGHTVTVTGLDSGRAGGAGFTVLAPDDGTDPGTGGGTDPGTDPEPDDGTDPGTGGGTDPGTGGTDPGTGGGDPGTGGGSGSGAGSEKSGVLAVTGATGAVLAAVAGVLALLVGGVLLVARRSRERVSD